MSKFLLATMVFFVSSLSYAQTHNWVEDNDLWKEDNVRSVGGLTQDVFNTIIQAGYDLYKPFADKNNETLVINRNWDDSTVNANTQRSWGTVTINMYGGLARREEVIPEGFALVLCHELGHAYGGTPYISEWTHMSAEGQADYYGSKECLKNIMAKVPTADAAVTEYLECKGDATCERQMNGAYSLGKLLSAIKNEPVPEFDTPDPFVTDVTMTSYPKTIQCRLDTYHNGIMGKDRPKCWFKN